MAESTVAFVENRNGLDQFYSLSRLVLRLILSSWSGAVVQRIIHKILMVTEARRDIVMCVSEATLSWLSSTPTVRSRHDRCDQ